MKSLSFALALLLAPLAHADDWHHVQRRSADGVQINLDYIVNCYSAHEYKPVESCHASPLYVNVSGPGITGSQAVRVVINSYQGIPMTPGFYPVPITYTLDLRWQGDHFSGEINDAQVNQGGNSYNKGSQWPFLIHTDGYVGSMPTRQDLAVVIDGRWIKDGDRNFELNLWEQR